METTILSVQNERVRFSRRLHTPSVRRQEGLFVMDGVKLFREALLCNMQIQMVFVQEDKREQMEEEIQRAALLGADVLLASRRVMEALSDVPTTQGLIFVCKMPEEKKLSYPLVALNGVQDPGNVGTILRTADAAGFGGVLLDTQCADPFSQKALRAAMGSAFRMPLLRTETLAQKLHELKVQEDASILCTSLQGTPFYQRAADRLKTVLVIGSEGHGIARDVEQEATALLRLPMRGNAESLNAACAASIMLYDIARTLFFS